MWQHPRGPWAQLSMLMPAPSMGRQLREQPPKNQGPRSRLWGPGPALTQFYHTTSADSFSSLGLSFPTRD